MYYAGKRRLSDGKLGHFFQELKDGKPIKDLGFSNKSYYALGSQYRILFLPEGKIRMQERIEDKTVDKEILKIWIKEELEEKALFEETRQKKLFIKKSEEEIMNMTLKELKENCQGDWRFRKVIFYWLMNGGSLF